MDKFKIDWERWRQAFDEPFVLENETEIERLDNHEIEFINTKIDEILWRRNEVNSLLIISRQKLKRV